MKTPSIFIIEDDQDIRDIFVQILEQEGYIVESFANGFEAIHRLKSFYHHVPCLIFLDMLMPIMTGTEFMSAFKDLPATIVSIPVFLISATSDEKQSKKMGCKGFSKKPINLNVILSIAEQHCACINNDATG
jgi:CheY-like chemotaxis protein